MVWYPGTCNLHQLGGHLNHRHPTHTRPLRFGHLIGETEFSEPTTEKNLSFAHVSMIISAKECVFLHPIQDTIHTSRGNRVMAQNTGNSDTRTTSHNRRESDEELMLQFQNGNEDAYTTLINRFYEPLRFFVNGFMNNADDTQDVLQETFVRLYYKKAQYNGQARLKTWLYMIAKNQALTAIARTRRNVYPESHEEDGDAGDNFFVDDETPQDVFSRIQVREVLDRALARINPDFAQVIILHYYDQYSYEEIAELLQLPLNTVRTRIYRGKQELASLLSSLRPESEAR